LFIRAQVQSYSWRRRKRERHILGRGIYALFELSLGIIFPIYIKEFFVGFSPP